MVVNDDWKDVEIDDWQDVSAESNKPNQKSIGGLLINAAKETPELAKGVWQGAKMATSLMRGDPREMAQIWQMAKNTPSALADTAINIRDSIKEKGVGNSIYDYVYEHPLSTAMNVSGGLGLASKVAGAGNLVRTANVLNKASLYANPITLPSKAVVGTANKLGPKVAPILYESAMKIPPSVPNDVRNASVKTGIEGGYTVSDKGLGRLRSNIDIVNRDIDSAIRTGAQRGSTIDMNSAASRIDQLKDYYKDYPRAEKYLDELDSIKTEVLYKKVSMPDGTIQMVEKYPNGVPLDQAQRMKQRIYQINRKHYGEMKSVEIEADKALARGLKEDIVSQYPDLANLNAKDSAMIQLDEFLERAVNRSRNYDVVKMGDQIMAVGGSVVGGKGGAIVAGTAKHIIDSPAFKSKLAILLNKARRVSGRTGNIANAGYQIGRIDQGGTE